MLRCLPTSEPNADLLVGLETGDDAGVYRLTADLALVQTVDYFTPIVDSPYDFGRIAAANALSDIYAMGATPLTVLNIVGFPISKLDKWILAEILRGASDTVREAGATLMGGHSIDDVDPKFGLAVTGTVHPDRIWTNAGAQTGDALILTKPIGAGIVTKAIKEAAAAPDVIEEAVHWMALLNRGAADIAKRYEVHAATDVTGFGLLGHALEMVRGAGIELVIEASRVPVLPQTRVYAEKGYVPAGSKRNLAFVSEATTFSDSVDGLMRQILADAVTSGGLLLAVPAQQAAALVAELRADGLALAAQIGAFGDARTATIKVV